MVNKQRGFSNCQPDEPVLIVPAITTVLAQIDGNAPTEVPPPPPDSGGSPILEAFSGLLSLAYFALFIWMLVECLRKDPDRFLWIWVILIFQPIGAIIYFFARWLPNQQVRAPQFLRRWTRGREIDNLRTEALQIGNAYQHVRLGDALREVGRHDQAGDAYEQALQKEPDNLQALWGAALVDMKQKNYQPARDRLEQVLEQDPEYKFGDVSLAYGKALYRMGESDKAREHLERHVDRWRHPEALYTLASIEYENGNPQAARSHLQAMLLDINSSPRAIARKYGYWKSRARRFFRKLPRSTR